VCCRVASTVLILIWFTLLAMSLGYSISMGIIWCILEHMIVKDLKLFWITNFKKRKKSKTIFYFILKN
jgi:xanthine/uracil/vitamin C permease (AzgA family)